MVEMLKALAEHRDISPGDLIDDIVLHAFDGRIPFSPKTLAVIGNLKRIYDLHLMAGDSDQLKESAEDL